MARNDAEVNVGANGTAFTKTMAELTKSCDTMANSITARLARMGGAWEAVKGRMQELRALGGMMMQPVIDSVQKAAAQEQLQVAFEVLLKGEEQALNFLEQLNEYAAKTPYSIDSISASAKTLLSMTALSGDEALAVIKQLGDVSAMTGKDLNELAQLYAKAVNTGVDNVIVKQLANAGFDLKGYIAQIQGISYEEVGEKISKGVVGIEHLNAALKLATAEGGKFFKGTSRLAETAAGKWSTLTDNINQAMMRFGEGVLPALKPAMDAITEAIQQAVPAVAALGEMFGDWLGAKVQDDVIPAIQDMVLHLPMVKKQILEAADSVGRLVEILLAVPNAINATKRGIGKLTSAVSIYFTGPNGMSWGESWKAAEGLMKQEEAGRKQEAKDEQAAMQRMIDNYQEKVKLRKEEAAARDKANADRAAAAAEALEGTKKQAAADTAAAEAEKARLAAEKKALEDNAKAYEEYLKKKTAWEARDADKARGKKDIGRQEWELRQEAFNRGIAGEVSPDSIRVKMDELAEAGAKTNEKEIEALQRLLDNWDALTEAKRRYQQQRADDEAELRIQALHAVGDEQAAKLAQERYDFEKRTRELREGGMGAASAAQQAALEAEIRQANEMRQKIQNARVEFIQSSQAGVGGGGVSIRVGESQLEEARKHTQTLDSIYSFLCRMPLTTEAVLG